MKSKVPEGFRRDDGQRLQRFRFEGVCTTGAQLLLGVVHQGIPQRKPGFTGKHRGNCVRTMQTSIHRPDERCVALAHGSIWRSNEK